MASRKNTGERLIPARVAAVLDQASSVVDTRSRLLRYGFAVAVVAVSAVVRWPLQPLLGASVPFLLFFPAVMLAAWFGGLGPGLVASALSAAAAQILFIGPAFSLAIGPGDGLRLLLFAAMGAVISVFIEELHRARRGIETAAMERAHLAAQLAAERERLETLIASVPGVVWEAWGQPDESAQRIDFVSRYVETMLGYSIEEWLATPNFWLSIVHPEDREAAAASAAAAFASGRGGPNRFRWMAKDGRILWVEAQAVVIRDPVGRPAGMRGVTIDVTERRRAEEERMHLLARAEEARRQAEVASRAKDDFLATLSHELRTPLNAILGWAQVLRMRRFDPAEADHGLATIARNAKLQAQLIEDLLDVSRIVAGKMRLDVRPIDLVPVVEAAIESIRPAADAKGIRLHRVFDPLGPVSGDADRLQQVVWNLLANAVKFTPKGGRVQVLLARVNSHVEVTVSDTGTGIAPDFLPYVFDRFRQSDASSTRRYGGLGLGLAIVRHLVELHGGTVTVRSDGEGKGATFIVSLPLSLVPPSPVAESAHPTAEVRDALGLPVPDLEGVRILVVEDDQDARELIAQVLTGFGAGVTAVASAREGLAALERERPDVLISDIEMPGEDGYELISRVRALPSERGGATPAAALTAFARGEDRRRALLAGFQLHVPKPVEPLELATVVANLAGRTRRASETS